MQKRRDWWVWRGDSRRIFQKYFECFLFSLPQSFASQNPAPSQREPKVDHAGSTLRKKCKKDQTGDSKIASTILLILKVYVSGSLSLRERWRAKRDGEGFIFISFALSVSLR